MRPEDRNAINRIVEGLRNGFISNEEAIQQLVRLTEAGSPPPQGVNNVRRARSSPRASYSSDSPAFAPRQVAAARTASSTGFLTSPGSGPYPRSSTNDSYSRSSRPFDSTGSSSGSGRPAPLNAAFGAQNSDPCGIPNWDDTTFSVPPVPYTPRPDDTTFSVTPVPYTPRPDDTTFSVPPAAYTQRPDDTTFSVSPVPYTLRPNDTTFSVTPVPYTPRPNNETFSVARPPPPGRANNDTFSAGRNPIPNDSSCSGGDNAGAQSIQFSVQYSEPPAPTSPGRREGCPEPPQNLPPGTLLGGYGRQGPGPRVRPQGEVSPCNALGNPYERSPSSKEASGAPSSGRPNSGCYSPSDLLPNSDASQGEWERRFNASTNPELRNFLANYRGSSDEESFHGPPQPPPAGQQPPPNTPSNINQQRIWDSSSPFIRVPLTNYDLSERSFWEGRPADSPAGASYPNYDPNQPFVIVNPGRRPPRNSPAQVAPPARDPIFGRIPVINGDTPLSEYWENRPPDTPAGRMCQFYDSNDETPVYVQVNPGRRPNPNTFEAGQQLPFNRPRSAPSGQTCTGVQNQGTGTQDEYTSGRGSSGRPSCSSPIDASMNHGPPNFPVSPVLANNPITVQEWVQQRMLNRPQDFADVPPLPSELSSGQPRSPWNVLPHSTANESEIMNHLSLSDRGGRPRPMPRRLPSPSPSPQSHFSEFSVRSPWQILPGSDESDCNAPGYGNRPRSQSSNSDYSMGSGRERPDSPWLIQFGSEDDGSAYRRRLAVHNFELEAAMNNRELAAQHPNSSTLSHNDYPITYNSPVAPHWAGRRDHTPASPDYANVSPDRTEPVFISINPGRRENPNAAQAAQQLPFKRSRSAPSLQNCAGVQNQGVGPTFPPEAGVQDAYSNQPGPSRPPACSSPTNAAQDRRLPPFPVSAVPECDPIKVQRWIERRMLNRPQDFADVPPLPSEPFCDQPSSPWNVLPHSTANMSEILNHLSLSDRGGRPRPMPRSRPSPSPSPQSHFSDFSVRSPWRVLPVYPVPPDQEYDLIRVQEWVQQRQLNRPQDFADVPPLPSEPFCSQPASPWNVLPHSAANQSEILNHLSLSDRGGRPRPMHRRQPSPSPSPQSHFSDFSVRSPWRVLPGSDPDASSIVNDCNGGTYRNQSPVSDDSGGRGREGSPGRREPDTYNEPEGERSGEVQHIDISPLSRARSAPGASSCSGSSVQPPDSPGPPPYEPRAPGEVPHWIQPNMSRSEAQEAENRHGWLYR